MSLLNISLCSHFWQHYSSGDYFPIVLTFHFFSSFWKFSFGKFEQDSAVESCNEKLEKKNTELIGPKPKAGYYFDWTIDFKAAKLVGQDPPVLLNYIELCRGCWIIIVIYNKHKQIWGFIGVHKFRAINLMLPKVIIQNFKKTQMFNGGSLLCKIFNGWTREERSPW